MELRMKRMMYLVALIALASTVSACDGNTPTTPSTPAPDASPTYSATLLPANEVPPVIGSEAGGSATATMTFNLTKDTGTTTAATLDVTVNATGLPAAGNPNGVARGQLIRN
jgi:hypothetical protein